MNLFIIILNIILLISIIILLIFFLSNRKKKIKKEVVERTAEFQSNLRNYEAKREKICTEIAELKYNQSILEAEVYVKKERMQDQLRKEEDLFENELSRRLESFLNSQNEKKEEINTQISELEKILNDYRKKREVINKEILRQKEISEKKNFYRILITKSDVEDIKVLKEISPKLRNSSFIPKVIWDTYINKPASDMVKRITNNKKISGIYKITYLPTGEAYIGKSTDIGRRWKDHIKTSVGLAGAAKSSFHSHMENHGFWMYTFEILEEVEKENLSEQEGYWINFYDTKNYGLNSINGQI